MKVVTILGIGHVKEVEERPFYKYDGKLENLYFLKKQRYTNMLPLLIDNFGMQNVVPIFTVDAKKTQLDVLKKEFQTEHIEIFKEQNFISDDKDFYEILRIINNATSGDDEYIIDLTHGFRHIPILATISLISQGLNNTDKIKHIFFAKEIEPYKDYEIIDLKEYLELANMSYMLETFDKNYTVSFVAAFENEDFKNLRGELTKFSNDILANSLKALENRFDIVLQYIENIKKNEQIFTFKASLDKIKEHIEDLKRISRKKDFQKLYEIAKVLNKKGYLLNAITLLFEGIGYYCVRGLENFDPKVEAYVKEFKNSKFFDSYILTNQSRTLVKTKKDRNSYLFGIEKAQIHFGLSEKEVREYLGDIKNLICDKLERIPNIENFRNFIFDAEGLRNNLAHGNSSDEIENTKLKFKQLLDEYKKFCIDDDILDSNK
ncbi:CRISPR-associated DxTHG motif protein [Campylobacter rectus]|uniref:CRISPR-associated DxTHG motif protein n=1 Tax=Campylobacter rectus TaxID=203 RepID=UPI000F5F508E|nr:TM1812 family CRISPR-associated protein [Campylobacter rectus]RRD53118.1 CRISPR-associated DxTHG motif protein [Campylobacter rectus]